MQVLADEGIGTMIHYPIPPHLQVAYAKCGYTKGMFPLAETFADDMLSLPIGPQMSHADQDRVIEAVNRIAPKL